MTPTPAPRGAASVRPYSPADLAAVVAADAAGHDPWGQHQLTEVLRAGNITCRVAVLDGRPVGFLMAARHKRRVEVIRLCVAGPARRRGEGRKLLVAELALAAAGKLGVTAKVPEPCLDAQLLFRACGVKAAGVKNDSILFIQPAPETAP